MLVRKNEVYLPMNGMYNDWLPVEAEAHQSWPPKNEKKTRLSNKTRKTEKEREKIHCYT